MVIVRLAVLSLALVACKDKAQPKPAPVTEQPQPVPPTPAPADAAPAPTPAPQTPPTAEVKPAGGFTTAVEYEAKANALMDELTAIFVAAGTNCDKLADGLAVYADRHKATLAGTREFETANPDAKRALEDKMQARRQQIMAKLSPSLQACQKHDGLRAVLQDIGAPK